MLEFDEVTDASNKEQVVVCSSWVHSHLGPHEHFTGLHVVEDNN